MRTKEIISIQLSRLLWLSESLPRVYVRRDEVYVCTTPSNAKSSARRRRHYSLYSDNGKKAIKVMEEIAYYNKRISFLSSLWLRDYSGKIPKAFEHKIKIKSPVGLDNDFFRQAESSSNSMAYKNTYTFMGINFRSKNELIVAELLNDMGLRFKYEPKIVFGSNTEMYPDFLINIVEADRCFFFEMQGMMNDINYAIKSAHKESLYISHGFRDGKDILFFKAGNDSIDFDVLRTLIEAVVEANIKEAFGLP